MMILQLARCRAAWYLVVCCLLAARCEAAEPNPARLPRRAARPVLKLTELPLKGAELKRQVHLFHKLAGRIAKENWNTEGYRDVRYSPSPIYVATWRTAKRKSSSYLVRQLPYQSLGISLEGAAGKDKAESLTSGRIRGSWVPRGGWAATVSCPLTQPFGTGGEAIVKQVFLNSSHFSFDWSNSRLNLLDTATSQSVREGNLELRYSLQLGSVGPVDRRLRFLGLYESPEKLREIVLADIANKRRVVKAQIPQLKSMSLIDHTHVRSDNPPRRMPLGSRRPSPKTIAALLKKTQAALDEKETLVQEHHRQIYEAINKALPLRKVLDDLLHMQGVHSQKVPDERP